MALSVRRVYDHPEAGQGTRVLVERLWPRGMRKAEAPIDRWLKEVAPTTALRKWYGHDPERWAEFQTRYIAELEANPEPVAELLALAASGDLVLVYSSREQQRNSARVLAGYLGERLSGAA